LRIAPSESGASLSTYRWAENPEQVTLNAALRSHVLLEHFR